MVRSRGACRTQRSSALVSARPAPVPTARFKQNLTHLGFAFALVACGGTLTDPPLQGDGEQIHGPSTGNDTASGSQDPSTGSNQGGGNGGNTPNNPGQPGGDGGSGGNSGSGGDNGSGGSSGNNGLGGNNGSGGDGAPQAPARSCKRGISYGYHSTADLTALSRGVSWWYNWASQPDEGVRTSFRDVGVEFVPMVWGGQFDVQQVIQQIPQGSRTLLGFNEPNFYSQSNMSAATAAANWPRIEEIADALGLSIASPAVNFCGGGCHEVDPFLYLQEFFAACQDCRVDYIAAHWYACTGDALRWYLDELSKFGKPIWLTEFSCGDDADRSLEVQKRYMREAVAILEEHPLVHRYAWFAGRTTAIPNVDLLGGDGQLTELGELYVSLPAGECPAP